MCLLIPSLKALRSKEEGKDQESLQSSNTPDPEHLWESYKTHKKA